MLNAECGMLNENLENLENLKGNENLEGLGADAPASAGADAPVVDYAGVVERLVKERLDAVIAERLCLAPERRVSGGEVDPFLVGLFGK